MSRDGDREDWLAHDTILLIVDREHNGALRKSKFWRMKASQLDRTAAQDGNQVGAIIAVVRRDKNCISVMLKGRSNLVQEVKATGKEHSKVEWDMKL